MKTIKLAAIALIFGGFAMSMNACGDKNDQATDQQNTVEGEVSANTKEADQGTGFAPSINIRYVDMAKILENYTFAAQENAKIMELQAQLQQYQNTLGAEIQQKGNDIQQKMNNNTYLTQQSYEADVKAFNALQQSSEKKLAAKAQQISKQVEDLSKGVENAIMNYINEYNATRKYDAILLKEAGLYFNPSLDITQEIIDGLNNCFDPCCSR